MSPKLPPLSGKDLVRLAIEQGFFFVSQKGSHAKYRNAEGRMTIIPMHGAEEIGPGLLRKILQDIGIDPQNLRK